MGVLVCDLGGKPYHGQAVHFADGRTYRRMDLYAGRCDARPRSTNAHALEAAFGQAVLGELRLDDEWVHPKTPSRGKLHHPTQACIDS